MWRVGYINTTLTSSSSQPRSPSPCVLYPLPPSLSPVPVPPSPGAKPHLVKDGQLSHSGGQGPAHPETLLFQNHSNSDVVSINCNVRLAPNQEINFHLLGEPVVEVLESSGAELQSQAGGDGD